MPFEIKVVEDTEWKKHVGRKEMPIPDAIMSVVRQGFNDGKTRAVVVPDNEVDTVIKQLRKASVKLTCTVTTQTEEDQPGYTKLKFRVGKRIYRPRKN